MTTRVYVGNLPMDIRTREVEDIFHKYGPIRDIDVKFPSRPPAFAFVDFEDSRDADDAIDGRDGYEFDGRRLRVEAANAGRRRGAGKFGRNVRGTGEYCVEISNLPERASWQDVKDYMRKAGDVLFAEVDGRGRGMCEYSSKEDMRYAIEKLDDTEFKGRNDRAFIRVREAKGGDKGRSRSRSKSRSREKKKDRSRSRSRSKSRSRSRSRSRSKSPRDEKDEKDEKDGRDDRDNHDDKDEQEDKEDKDYKEETAEKEEKDVEMKEDKSPEDKSAEVVEAEADKEKESEEKSEEPQETKEEEN